MNSFLYLPVYLYSVIILTIITAFAVSGKSFKQLSVGNKGFMLSIILSTILAIWLGQRPITYDFGDTPLYAHIYEMMKGVPMYGPPAGAMEMLWVKSMYFCSQSMDVSGFFTIVSLLYFTLSLLACRRLVPNQVWVMFIALLGSFSFYSYGTNGIRNGLACSFVLLCISFAIKKSFSSTVMAIVLAFLAINIHKSAALPLLALLLSVTCLKNFKTAYCFWIFAIFGSLLFGNYLANILSAFGYDDRLTYYLNNQDDVAKFSQSGFRLDFLIYSAVPIILGYYVIIKKKIMDHLYTILLNTYTLSNAVWVIIIRASYSNRFAYLSWFMYSIVLIYPFLKLNLFGKKQGAKLSLVIMAQVLFLWIMETI